MAAIVALCGRKTSTVRSPFSHRIRSCSQPRCATAFAAGVGTRLTRKCKALPASRRCTTTSWLWLRGTIQSSASGRVLSGGQVQRVNLARAVLKNASILRLDEATSSFDSIAESKVQRAIDRLVPGAHRRTPSFNPPTRRPHPRARARPMHRAGLSRTVLGDCPLYRSHLGNAAAG